MNWVINSSFMLSVSLTPASVSLETSSESTDPQCLHVEQIRALGEEMELTPGCSEALTMSRLQA